VRPSFYLKGVLTLFFIILMVWLASRRTFFGDTITSAFLSVALLSVFLILLRTHFSWLEVGGVFLLAAAFAFLDLVVLRYPVRWPVWPSFVGLASLVLLACRAVWSQGDGRRLAMFTVVPAFLFVASEWCADYFLAWTQHAHPKVLDLYLYSFDASLHIQIPFLMGQLFSRSFSFAIAGMLAYVGLPVAIGLAYAGCLLRDRRHAASAFVALLLTGPVGAVFYGFFPALGPVHIFKDAFPWHPLTIDQASRLFLEPIAAVGPRNAMPSLHAAWAYLVFWYARRLSMLEKVAAGVFAFLTLCAAVGGEHYFIDLIVAVPFALFIAALAHLVTGRHRSSALLPVSVGLATTVAWLLALRFAIKIFWLSPAIPWAACLLTLVVCYASLRPLLDRHRQSSLRDDLQEGAARSATEPNSPVGKRHESREVCV